MSKTKSGAKGNGMGHWSEWNGGRATRTKGKTDLRKQEDRRNKQKGWD